MGRAWPLVGRQEELAFVERILGERRSQNVIIAGVAGVGKSRLAAEAVAMAERAGLTSLRVHATASSAVTPFGALAHLLSAGLSSAPDLENVLRLAADALIERSGGSGPAWPRRTNLAKRGGTTPPRRGIGSQQSYVIGSARSSSSASTTKDSRLR